MQIEKHEDSSCHLWQSYKKIEGGFLLQPNGRNDRVGKLKEVIANTEDNLDQANQILASMPLTENARQQIEQTNQNRVENLEQAKEALNEEFHD